jgi:hypothetical protein
VRQLLLLFVFSIGSGGEAQTTRPIDVPWVGVIYLLDPVTQALKPLPDEMWHIRLGLGRIATVSQDVSGERSSFRITTHTPQFVFQFGSPENANLYISNNKTKRRFPVQAVNNRDNGRANLPGLPVEVTDLGPSTYKMLPKSVLEPGEYAVTLKASAQVRGPSQVEPAKPSPYQLFTFGIDQ